MTIAISDFLPTLVPTLVPTPMQLIIAYVTSPKEVMSTEEFLSHVA